MGESHFVFKQAINDNFEIVFVFHGSN